ncbi:c-type cytochrome biogenesis protein CcsB [Guyparkeria hydrothermalis]|uniref:c-type cytochrome biogenesis protein CcsB n=1 Tax=Guyparkeria hydrothermalis TaxID=923 RepID=UPI0020226729|nr:c-type cytochrome biogenesis protein CcsB [Guyparkeria hydrothermalis]MCL7745020.1 c-type cytochrome biogenesis protein CcsB [Guyparkeria hydrothermalis]
MSVPNEQMLGGFEPASELPARRRVGVIDVLWALAMLLAAGIGYSQYSASLDYYATGTLFGAALGLGFLGWIWPATRWLTGVVAVVSLYALWQYNILGADGAVGREALAQFQESSFLFKFLLSSQAATMWMVALFFLSIPTYFISLAVRSEYGLKVGSALVWSGVAMAFIGFFSRWRESYLINLDYGHIPVSNLYEVFIVFAVVTALLYLFYEKRYNSRSLGGFVMTIVGVALGFLMWYQFTRDAEVIAPLVPALNSWWMKIHVPANFIGYGTFAIAAMVGIAYLIKQKMGGDGPNDRLPSLKVMDDIQYKAIALGFAFFTIATILGAMWAAEAWGGYWSWDPKETWALIVWLNYAAWLHMRLTKGWRGPVMAWWSIGGLFITSFAFLGVNMFLSGLHSYGEL